jgi:ribonuclease HI
LTVFKDASRRHEEYRSALKKDEMLRQSHSSTLNSNKSWKCPDLGYVKVNWDASLNVRNGVVGLGCVNRSDDGVIVGAKCCACMVEASPLLAKCMAAYSALNFYKDMGFFKIICEGGSLQVVKAICDPSSPYVKIGHFVDAIRKDASDFTSFSWAHCCREANVVAHQLAREASSKCLSYSWIEEMPIFISDASFRDLLVSRL